MAHIILASRPSPKILSHTNDQVEHELLEVLVRYELVSNGLTLRKKEFTSTFFK